MGVKLVLTIQLASYGLSETQSESDSETDTVTAQVGCESLIFNFVEHSEIKPIVGESLKNRVQQGL